MIYPSAKAVIEGHGRLIFQEAVSLRSLPDKITEDGNITKRYMSRRRVWITGDDLVPLVRELGYSSFKPGISAYGGHVYAQACLATSRGFRAMQRMTKNGGEDKKFGMHTIHGVFSEPGLDDRPFIYEVSSLASNASFPNLLVTVRQPTEPSINPEGDFYPEADADLPAGPVCFSAMITFRPAGFSQIDLQEPSPHLRFASILNSRRPTEWDPSPITDIDGILDMIPGSRKAMGLFPGLEMRKVDMRAYNADRPLHERRELILYRLLAPLPATAAEGESDREDGYENDGADAHICAHAYAADRNGLLMMGNNIGFGTVPGGVARAASLSYSLYVHVDAADAVMTYSDGDDQWWLQEMCYPRVQVGRGNFHCKIWSPRGVHVATEYQDGIIRRQPRRGEKGYKEKTKDRGKL